MFITCQLTSTVTSSDEKKFVGTSGMGTNLCLHAALYFFSHLAISRARFLLSNYFRSAVNG